MSQQKNLPVIVMIVSLCLVLTGAGIAQAVHTSGGAVKIHDITFVTVDGAELRALLYIPNSASAASPAPAVIACHGYNNTLEVLDMHCIELSKRGFVVMAIDDYGHGGSGFQDPRIIELAPDMGAFAAIQYLGTIPLVDRNRIGLIGHSMGSEVIQRGAYRAWKAHETDPSVVTPAAVLLTANAFVLDGDGQFILAPYPVSVGDIFGAYDEFSIAMWGTLIGKDLASSVKAKAGMGLEEFAFGEYYSAGNPAVLDRNGAVSAAKDGSLRVFHLYPHTHTYAHFSNKIENLVLDFFDITLNGGRGYSIPPSQQSWFGKQLGTAVSLVFFFVFIAALGLVLLKAAYFAAIRKPEPQGITNITDAGSLVRYWVIFIIGLLPAPLLINWATGFAYHVIPMGSRIPTVLPASWFLPLTVINGIFLLNILTGLIAAAIYAAVFFIFAKKAGAAIANTGLQLEGGKIGRAALLAIAAFAGGYFLLVLCDYFFKTDLRFFTLCIRPLPAYRWAIMIRYLPAFLFFYIVSAVTQNTFTRINGQKEWVNMLLIVASSMGGLLVMHLIDYIAQLHLGVKIFFIVPGTGGQIPAALSGLLLWNLLFILPVAAVTSRVYFRATGSVWTGAFINALTVALFAVSNTVLAWRV